MMDLKAREGYVPYRSSQYANEVAVGWLLNPMTRPQLIAFVFAVQPNNRDREYNCHSWVQEVLQRMRDSGHILPSTYDVSLDAMIGLTLEAEDE